MNRGDRREFMLADNSGWDGRSKIRRVGARGVPDKVRLTGELRDGSRFNPELDAALI
jgi:hypothetical protein